MLADRHNIIGGELELRTENKAPPYFKISVSDDLKKDVYELASTVRANMRQLKGEVERAKRLVLHSPVNLQPYEEYLNGIESEVRDLIVVKSASSTTSIQTGGRRYGRPSLK